MLPDGLVYLDSWIDARDLLHCYQLIETDDPALIDGWISNWSDIVDFEVIPVIGSAEAAERAAANRDA